ncbi:MAG: response regulator transcription factor [Niastella sp.]|nr:response regulator transcription factor [Niastella sp.]
MTTTAIIVEDDPMHAHTLQLLIEKLDSTIKIAGVYSTVEESSRAIDQHQPGLVFLDIDLERGDNGFDLLKRFPKPGFSVIFTTQHNSADNAILAIRACALDFLPKPILEQELADALARVDKNKGPEQTGSLRNNLEAGKPGYIWLSDLKGKTLIDVSNIRYCESSNSSYTHFFLDEPVNGLSQYTESKGIGIWEKILSGTHIIRTHNKFLLNLKHMGKYCQDHFLLRNGTKIPIARGRKQEVKDALDRFRKGL